MTQNTNYDNGADPSLNPEDLDQFLEEMFAADQEAQTEPTGADKTSWTAGEILTTEFPDPKWAVPGLLPYGLTICAGRPKMGKSWLALQIACAVGTGGYVLGRQVEAGKVLYLALEDSPRRLKDRMQKQRVPATANVRFEFQWEPFTGKGIADLMLAIATEGYSLVIVDTFSRALGKQDQMDQTDMTLAVGSLQRMAQHYGTSLFLVDHHRKNAGDTGDPIDDIMGATSKAAVADAAMGLFRQRGQQGAVLKVTGRDLADQELSLQWDGELFCWQSLGEVGKVQTDTLQADILFALEDMGGSATTTEIANYVGREKGNVSRELQELIRKGVVRRGEKVGKTVPYVLINNNHHNDHNGHNHHNGTTVQAEQEGLL